MSKVIENNQTYPLQLQLKVKALGRQVVFDIINLYTEVKIKSNQMLLLNKHLCYMASSCSSALCPLMSCHLFWAYV